MDIDEKELRQAKIREQVGILLICLVLAGSGILLLQGGSGTAPISFVEGSVRPVSTGGNTESAKAVTTEAASTASKQSSTTAKDPVVGKININTASIEDLDRLPGVGPATAQKIIDYRKQNGLFPNIESIDNVSGIGPSKYAQMKDLITI